MAIDMQRYRSLQAEATTAHAALLAAGKRLSDAQDRLGEAHRALEEQKREAGRPIYYQSAADYDDGKRARSRNMIAAESVLADAQVAVDTAKREEARCHGVWDNAQRIANATHEYVKKATRLPAGIGQH